jgi:DeoR/GlpR family transcriptional regulator of sugar metabolism
MQGVRTMKLKKRERQNRIIEEIRKNITIRVSVIADMFEVTTETVRRDLQELSQKGLLDRTYGGAAGSVTQEPAVRMRELFLVEERLQIAESAVSLIKPADVLMIDAGSTNIHFARELSRLDLELNVITNCVPVASILSENRGMSVILCPGEFNNKEDSVIGMETHHFLSKFNANKAVISASGLSTQGITDVNSEASWIKRTMIEHSDVTILLVDQSKFNKQAMEIVCPLEKIDSLVTNAEPDALLREALDMAQVNIHSTDQ